MAAARTTGGGVWRKVVCRIVNCTFVGNSAPNAGEEETEAEGSGLFWLQIGDPPYDLPEVENSIFYFNGVVDKYAETVQIRVPSIGNTPGLTVEYCDIQELDDFGAMTGNFDADPDFVNLATGDLHLTYGSPCKNAGRYTDFDNIPPDCWDDGTTPEAPECQRDDEGETVDCDIDEDGCTDEFAPDRDRRERIRDDVVDVGAHEYACPGDVAASSGNTPDGVVNIFDQYAILSAWGTRASGCGVFPGELAPDYTVCDVFDWYVYLSHQASDCDEQESFTQPQIPMTVGDCIELYGDNENALIVCLQAIELMEQYDLLEE